MRVVVLGRRGRRRRPPQLDDQLLRLHHQRGVRPDRAQRMHRQLRVGVPGEAGCARAGPPGHDRRHPRRRRRARDRRGRRDRRRPPPPQHDDRVLAQPRSDEGQVPRRLAAHRRPRDAWTPTATCGSSHARTTSSTRPATASARARSRARWAATRRSRWRPSSACPTSAAGGAEGVRRAQAGLRAERGDGRLPAAVHPRRGSAAHEVPRQIEFLDDLPKTTTGKIMRRALRSDA